VLLALNPLTVKWRDFAEKEWKIEKILKVSWLSKKLKQKI